MSGQIRQQRVLFLGHFGAGNLGNECTLQAAIQQVTSRWAGASVHCACTVPDDVQRRHGIPAYPWKRASSFSPSYRVAHGEVPPKRPPILRRLVEELASYAVGVRALWRSDILVVCGTNLVSDYMTGPKGWPYDLFKWSVLARLCRVRVLFLGIGVGPINHPLSRWLIGRSLAFADYRSYRDDVSRQWAAKVGVPTGSDVVCPDLVFSLSPASPASTTECRGERPVIGVGLKNYQTAVEHAEPDKYRSYVNEMVAFISWLLRHGYDVRLLVGDLSYDLRVEQDVLAAIQDHLEDTARIRVDIPTTVEDLIAQIAETDAVISPRFHNLVLGLILNKPVIALSDHHKLDELMAASGLADYVVPLATLKANDLISRFRRAEDDAPSLKAGIAARVAAFRRSLDEQYDAALAAAGAVTPGSVRRLEPAPTRWT